MAIQKKIKICLFCGIQNTEFNDKSINAFANHIKKHSTDTYTCNQCDKVVNTKGKLADHIKFKHSGPHTCELCHKIFSSIQASKRHTRTVHNRCLKQCNMCQKEINDNLKRHKQICLAKNLMSGRTSVDSRPTCKVCKQVFHEYMDLGNHKSVCKKPQLLVSCLLCPKSFATKKSYYNHKNAVHSLMNKRLTQSNYWVKDLESEKHAENLHNCVQHVNAYNI